MNVFELEYMRNRYGKVTVINIPGSNDVFLVQSIRPHRALTMAYIREVRVVLAKTLGYDPQSIVVGSDYDVGKLLLPGELTRMILTGELTQR